MTGLFLQFDSTNKLWVLLLTDTQDGLPGRGNDSRRDPQTIGFDVGRSMQERLNECANP